MVYGIRHKLTVSFPLLAMLSAYVVGVTVSKPMKQAAMSRLIVRLFLLLVFAPSIIAL